MADPVSSVAYAIEAALRALDGHLDDLFPTMAIVIGVVVLVTINYWFLVRRFPLGGGDAEAAGRAFGTAWAFPVIGALIVDFCLTISISIAAATSAIIAYVPGLHAFRIPIALLLCAVVAGLTWFGHAGRVLFATFTISFIAACSVVLVKGYISPTTVLPDVGVAITGRRCRRRSSRSCSRSRWRWRWRPGSRRRSPRSRSSGSSTTTASGSSAAARWC